MYKNMNIKMTAPGRKRYPSNFIGFPESSGIKPTPNMIQYPSANYKNEIEYNTNTMMCYEEYYE